MTIDAQHPARFGRRGLFIGAGAAALVGTGLLAGETAQAESGPSGDGIGNRPLDGSPFGSSIASAPKSGYTYRSVCMYDFEPFNPAAQKTWGGSGIYSAGTASPMRATVEVPAGARLKEVEFYVYSTSATAPLGAYLYAPGSGFISEVGSMNTPVTSGIAAVTMPISSTSWGPYPSGSRLLLSCNTPSDGSVQVNGARLGFTEGSADTGLLVAPIRAYDSRTTSKLAARSTRTITLPASIVPPGVTGVLVNVTAVGAGSSGYLKVYSGAAAAPSASSINYSGSGAAIANAMTVGVSASRTIKVYASSSVHVIIDITGTVS